MDTAEKEKIVETIQPYARKLAHFTLYAIGGIIMFLNLNEYNLPEDKKLFYSGFFCSFYAVTDEIHQLFVPR